MLVVEEGFIECFMIAATLVAVTMLVYMVVGLVRGQKGASTARRRDPHHDHRVDRHRRTA